MLECFFMSSPVGILRICVKKYKLYSISSQKLEGKPLNIPKSKISKIVDKKNSFIFNEETCQIVKQDQLSSFAGFVKHQIQSYFVAQLKKFNIPLFMLGTEFQKKVWRSLQNIPWGHTIAYGELADKLKSPGSARAIGNCCAKNPFLLVVPCHRVLSQNGYGGFALGLKAKKYLLALEERSKKL